MRNWNALRERFVRFRFAVQLGNIASGLASLDNYISDPLPQEVITSVLEESKFFVNWALLGADLPQQFELAVLQQRLIQWQLHWAEIGSDPVQRAAVAAEAHQWSDRILAMSGLLNPVEEATGSVDPVTV
jgi:hypothetical protein